MRRRLQGCVPAPLLGSLIAFRYCRPATCRPEDSGSGGVSGRSGWVRRERGVSVDAGLLGGCDPPPGGRSLAAALSGEGDPTLDTPLSIPSFPSGPILPLPCPSPSFTVPLRGHLLHNHVTLPHSSLTHPPLSSFRATPSARAQQGAVNSLRSANFHTFFQARNADTSSEAPSGSANSALLQATPFFTLAQPRRLAEAFREA